jgi:circadian clock protein KaiC
VVRFGPTLVVLDPISAFLGNADQLEVQAMLLRMVDFLKARGISAVFTHLMHSQDGASETDVGLSSLMDAWILLLNRETNGEYNRELYLLKARGTSHSNQVREFVMSDNGIRLIPPYLGEGRALTGSARRAQEARDRRDRAQREHQLQRQTSIIEKRREKAKAEIAALQVELEADEMELSRMLADEENFQAQVENDLAAMEKSRRARSGE